MAVEGTPEIGLLAAMCQAARMLLISATESPSNFWAVLSKPSKPFRIGLGTMSCKALPLPFFPFTMDVGQVRHGYERGT